jgi:hypothetical protein
MLWFLDIGSSASAGRWLEQQTEQKGLQDGWMMQQRT